MFVHRIPITRGFACNKRPISSPIDAHLTWLSQAPSKISTNSLKRLKFLHKPTVRQLIPELVKENELGYQPSSGAIGKGTLVDFVVEQKRLHPDKIILVRVGEFYETYGLDALLLIEYAGLNPMGNKARAGCPIKNIQQTLDHLTNAGLVIAVYEEINFGRNQVDVKKGKIKHRVLSQVISQAAPTYTYDLKLSDNLDYRESRPILGINSEVGGYNLCQIFVDEKAVILREKLPFDALKTLITSCSPLEPIYVSPSLKGLIFRHLGITEEVLSIDNIVGNGMTDFHEDVLLRVCRELTIETSGFRKIHYSQEKFENTFRPQPLNLFTAQEIGVVSNPHVPLLVRYLLPSAAAPTSQKYLRQLLVSPPPHSIADSLRSILAALSKAPNLVSLPKMTTPGLGKVVSLLSAARCNVSSFREIAQNIRGVINLLEITSDVGKLVSWNLFRLVEYECGVLINRDEFHSKLVTLDSIISGAITLRVDLREYTYCNLPEELRRRNESTFRDIFVKGFDKEYDSLLEQLDDAIANLNHSVTSDFTCLLSSSDIKRKNVEVVYDSVNNIIAFKSTSKTLAAKHFKDKDFYHPLDRNSQPLTNRYTSSPTSSALSTYLHLCHVADSKAIELMEKLCNLLYKDIVTLIQSIHCAVIFQCAYEHTLSSLQRQWILPNIVCGADIQSPRVFEVHGLVPYWMDMRSSVKNNLVLSDIIFLTAPNMAGKSTLMRSVLVAALLGNCGLFVPCSNRAIMPHYDAYFLRTSSFDVPSEGKSSFAVEMSDLAVIMRDSSIYSFIMLDEIGRGTSPLDGTCLSGAILEWMSRKKCHGIFSTHIHDTLKLPLNCHLRKMKMGVKFIDGRPVWTYQLEEGFIDDSLALETASRFGVSHELIQRAQELKNQFAADQTPLIPEEQRILPLKSYHTNDIKDLLSSTLRGSLFLQQHLISESVTVILDGYLPPPALEHSCCVYLLLLRGPPRDDGSLVSPAIYIGETESITVRLKSHRHNQRLREYLKTPQLEFDTLAIQVRNKSAARAIETFLITHFSQLRYDLCSDHDKSHTRFSLH